MVNLSTEQLLVKKEKVTNYLLNIDHPDGRSKANFFISHGFSRSEWKSFAGALRKHAKENAPVSEEKNQFGTKYVIEGFMETPVTKKVLIRSVWMVKIDSEQPELITAYPI